MAKRQTPDEFIAKSSINEFNKEVIKLMELYAKQEAVAFHLWIGDQKRANNLKERGLMKLWWDYSVERSKNTRW